MSHSFFALETIMKFKYLLIAVALIGTLVTYKVIDDCFVFDGEAIGRVHCEILDDRQSVTEPSKSN